MSFCFYKSKIGPTHRNSVVWVVKDNLHKGSNDTRSSPFMKKSLTLFWSHVAELVWQHELDCCKPSTDFYSSLSALNVLTYNDTCSDVHVSIKFTDIVIIIHMQSHNINNTYLLLQT